MSGAGAGWKLLSPVNPPFFRASSHPHHRACPRMAPIVPMIHHEAVPPGPGSSCPYGIGRDLISRSIKFLAPAFTYQHSLNPFSMLSDTYLPSPLLSTRHGFILVDKASEGASSSGCNWSGRYDTLAMSMEPYSTSLTVSVISKDR